jgi:hypothetical protein
MLIMLIHVSMKISGNDYNKKPYVTVLVRKSISEQNANVTENENENQ